MICVNELTEQKCNKRKIISDFTILLSSYAPYISEEIWQNPLDINVDMRPEEYNEIKKHPQFGSDLLEELNIQNPGVDFEIVKCFNLSFVYILTVCFFLLSFFQTQT